jgi:hypothetical protein
MTDRPRPRSAKQIFERIKERGKVLRQRGEELLSTVEESDNPVDVLACVLGLIDAYRGSDQDEKEETR